MFKHTHKYFLVGFLLVFNPFLKQILLTSFITNILHLPLQIQTLLIRCFFYIFFAYDAHPSFIISKCTFYDLFLYFENLLRCEFRKGAMVGLNNSL